MHGKKFFKTSRYELKNNRKTRPFLNKHFTDESRAVLEFWVTPEPFFQGTPRLLASLISGRLVSEIFTSLEEISKKLLSTVSVGVCGEAKAELVLS